MAIKKMGAAAASEKASGIRRMKNRSTDSGARFSKVDHVDELLLFTSVAYDDAHVGQYGTTQQWKGDIVNVSTGEKFADDIEHGNLAKQLGELEVGETGLGRITKGLSDSGRGFYGVTWAESDEDYAAAESLA